MKKLLVSILCFTAVSLFASVSTAQAAYTERTDAYALDAYKYSGYSDDPAIVAQANEIVAGIPNDYDKVLAIYQWVWDNMTYTENVPDGLTGIDEFKYGVCVEFAETTMYLAQAAGFPAKYVEGSIRGGASGGHAWTKVYVDNRWVLIDSTNGLFDKISSSYSNYEYSLQEQDAEAWTGSLYFYNFTTSDVLKEVKNFPINGLVTSTYGFDIKTLYFDKKYTKPFTLDTMKVNASKCVIYVKPTVAKKYKVTFNSKSGSTVKALTVTAKSKITKPTNPKRTGYTFVGWYKNSKCTVKWDFEKNKITAKTTLYAKWKKI